MNNNIQYIVPNILKRLAHIMGTEIKGRTLVIPAKFGKGYCTGYIFNEHIRLMISNYELNEDVIVENPDVNTYGRMIVFKFQNIFPKAEALLLEQQLPETPSVLIATSRVNTDRMIPIHTNTSTINIEVNADYLNNLFDTTDKSPILQNLLENAQPLLFEQVIYPSIQKIVDEILSEHVEETFKLFYLRIKAEELVCRLLMELEKRDEKQLYPLNNHDIETLYKIKEQILRYPGTPPVINDLAQMANMSTSKLKRLFRQIFGNSIFSYYQEYRMKEAARLLREEKRSVSEVGYELGFTNLSHFARVFKEHIGMKPKQYSRSK